MTRPKLLLVDLETAPAIVYTFQLFDCNIGIEQIISPGRVICWAAKWYKERKVMFAEAFDAVRTQAMLKEIHALLCEADAVIGWNSERFDLPKLDGEFIVNGLSPPPPPTHIDLWKTARKLGLLSTKLAFVAPLLKAGKKIDTGGFKLWADVMRQDAAACKRMQKYNEQDVRLLEPMYDRMLPFIRNHPFLGTTAKKDMPECPACQSHRSQSRGTRRTKSYIIWRMQCLDCGSWFEGKRQKA